MSGTSDGKPSRRGALARPSSLLLGALAVAVAVAGLVAFATIDAPPLPTRHVNKTAVDKTQDEASERAPAFADDVSLPPPVSPPPPTTAEVEAAVPPPASPPPPAPAAASARTATAADPASLPIAELRNQANLKDLPSMMEIARRLILGVGIAKDPQAGAGWMLRAAELGSMQAAFNVGVMYESGFVVERDSSRAAQWYRRAADGGIAAAQHNLALLLREGRGVPRDGAEAVKLLHEAARKGMTASMFTLGDIYEQGDAAPKDLAAAAAWFAITAKFERQANNDKDTQLARTALQRSQTLQRALTPAEMQRARELGESEVLAIVQAMSPPQPGTTSTLGPAAEDPAAGWPAGSADQVRAIQQALFDLKLLNSEPDGTLGPMTRGAIRDFQRSAGRAETGEPTKEVYTALKTALARRDAATPGVGLPAAALPSPAASSPATPAPAAPSQVTPKSAIP